MSDSEAETIWMSRIDMNIPNTMMMNATTRLGSIRSESTGGAPNIAGLAVVALAICAQVTGRAYLLRLNRAGGVEVGVGVRILRAVVGVDGGVDRHPGTQQVLPRDVLRHAD